MLPQTAIMPAPSEAPVAPPGTDGLAGDDLARFSQLVEEHQHRLCNFIHRYTRNRQDAEDLTQETFCKAFRNFHRFDHRAPFAAWLYTIARNTVYNHHRDRKPTQELNFDVASAAQSPDTTAERADESAWAWKKLEQLPPLDREVLTLKYIEDLSIKEIAQILNRTQTGVKVLLFRARARLRKLHPSLPPSA